MISSNITGVNIEEKRNKRTKKQNRSKALQKSNISSKHLTQAELNKKKNTKHFETINHLLRERKEGSSLPVIKKNAASRIGDVKEYFKNNESDLANLERNFRQKKAANVTSNAKFSRTFFNTRKERIENNLEDLYRKKREVINRKLKDLEKQKFFRSEIEIRQKQLNICKQEADELKYDIEKKKKRLKNLTEQLATLVKKYDTSEYEKNLVNRQDEIEEIDKQTINEKFTTSSLNWMLDSYKADILRIKMKVQRWKELMKKLEMEETVLKMKEDKLNLQVAKLLSKLVKGQGLARADEKELDPLFNQDIEDELSIFEDRITIEKIAKHEKSLERERDHKLMQERKKREESRRKRNHAICQKQKRKNKKMREDLSKCEIKIDNLLKVMMISDPMLIEDTYNGLIEDEVSIKKIINEHRSEIKKTEEEIKQLRLEYQNQSLVGEASRPEIVVKADSTSMTETEMSETVEPEIEAKKVEAEKKDLVGGAGKKGKKGKMLSRGLEADRIEQLEKEISHYSNVLLLTESSHQKLNDILQDSCSTVSRIMYQLEPRDKTKNIKVDKDDVVEYLSHIGLKLERMLAFVQTKNKIVKDETILMKGVFNKSTNRKDMYKTPAWLGLRPGKTESSEEPSIASADLKIKDSKKDKNESQASVGSLGK